MTQEKLTDEALIREICELIPLFEQCFIRPYMLLAKDTLSGMQLRVLFQLKRAGQVAMSDLARMMEIAPPQLTSLINGMVREGFVKRCTMPDDRRVVFVRLTEKAETFYESTQQAALSINQHRLDLLSSEEKHRLYQDAEDLRAILSKIHPEG